MSRVVLVTGANRGIGREVALQLYGQGLTVIACARDPESAVKSGHESTDRWSWQSLDVTSDESVQQLFARVHEAPGQLDILINNAGVMDKAPLTEGNVESVKRTMEANFYGPMRMNSTFLPLLQQSSDGRIINVSSQMGAFHSLLGGYAGYRLSKTGLNAQTALLSNELAGTAIRVNAVCPGWVRTDMGGSGAPGTVQDGADSIVWLATAKQIPNGKFVSNRKVIEW